MYSTSLYENQLMFNPAKLSIAVDLIFDKAVDKND